MTGIEDFRLQIADCYLGRQECFHVGNFFQVGMIALPLILDLRCLYE